MNVREWKGVLRDMIPADSPYMALRMTKKVALFKKALFILFVIKNEDALEPRASAVGRKVRNS